MYAGPISQSTNNRQFYDFIGLQIEPGGRQLTLAYSLGSAGIVSSTFQVNVLLEDDNWHQIDLILSQQLVRNDVFIE